MIGITGYNRWSEIAEKFPKELHKVVVQTTEFVRDTAAANAPVRTGFLRSSIYSVTSEGSTYGQAMQAPGDSYLLPEGPEVTDPYTGYVGVAASYSVFVELGTRYQSAQAFFYPALDAGRARFEAALAAIESFL